MRLACLKLVIQIITRYERKPITKASIFELARGMDGMGELPWQSPHPLQPELRLYPSQLDSLPPLVREAVRRSPSFTQAPIALIASCALSSLSLVGRFTSMWRGRSVNQPGQFIHAYYRRFWERKSTCDGNFNSPVRQHERDQSQAREPEVSKYRQILRHGTPKWAG